MVKKLEVGITKIAEVTVADPETQQPLIVPLYYGNHIEIGNTLGMVSKQQYYSCLDVFFNTKEGHEYDRPDEKQVEADIALLHNRARESPRKEENNIQEMEKKKPDHISLELEQEENRTVVTNTESTKNSSQYRNKYPKKKQNSMMELFDLGTENNYINTIQQEKNEGSSNKISGKYISKSEQKQEIKHKIQNRQEKENKATIHNRKEHNVFKLTTVLLMLLCVGMGYYIYLSYTGDNVYEVIQLVRNVSKGEKITEDDFTKVELPISQFEKFSGSTFIDVDGKEKKDSLILYANRNQIEGKYASSDLKEGDYLTTSSYTALSLDASNIVYMQLDDGTEVQIKATDLDAGKSTVHLYAVISSSTDEGKITNTAVDLGEISFEGKTLTDILNQEGISLIQNNVSEN